MCWAISTVYTPWISLEFLIIIIIITNLKLYRTQARPYWWSWRKILIAVLFLGHCSDDNTVRAGSVTMAVSVGIHANGKYACCPGRCHRGLGTGPELNSCFSVLHFSWSLLSGPLGTGYFSPLQNNGTKLVLHEMALSGKELWHILMKMGAGFYFPHVCCYSYCVMHLLVCVFAPAAVCEKIHSWVNTEHRSSLEKKKSFISHTKV